MPQKSTLEQMLEHLVNDEQQKAEELFHEYVVAKSREIYENLIEAEMDDMDDDDMDDKPPFAGTDDETDDFADEIDDKKDDMDDMDNMDDTDMEQMSDEELFQELKSYADEIQARFDAQKDGTDMSDTDMDDTDMDDTDMDDTDMGDTDDQEMKDDFDLETVREYVEKVPAGHGAEKKGQAEKADGSAGGMKFSANNMGGTTASFRGGEAREASRGTAGGLAKNKPQDMKTGNINVPGGKAGKTGFTHKEPGHGAEKKGAAEGGTDGQSLFRGRSPR